MNKVAAICLFVCLAINAGAQFDAGRYNSRRLDINKKGMLVLGSWGAANLIAGAIGTATSSGTTKYFHEMNLGWGAINGVLAGVNLLQLKKQKNKSLSFGKTVSEQQKIERIFLINAGLDLAYLGAGAWMVQKSKADGSNRMKWKGFGNSLLMQGGVLLLFDGIMFSVHHRHGKKLAEQLNKIQLTAGAGTMGISLNL